MININQSKFVTEFFLIDSSDYLRKNVLSFEKKFIFFIHTHIKHIFGCASLHICLIIVLIILLSFITFYKSMYLFIFNLNLNFDVYFRYFFIYFIIFNLFITNKCLSRRTNSRIRKTN
jgi:hypothetical protein